ncbi:MAG: ATP-binding protein, partial [Pseudomonadales bacterium]|nr:ATP-binding protein [Pseudomonadales bacterium]
LQGAIARINDVVLGQEDVQQLAQRVIEAIAELLDARVGAFYTAEGAGEPRLTLMGTYAYTKRKNLSSSFAFGESLVGQAALERQQILISSVPEDYIRVTSGLGDAVPTHICVTPFIYESRVLGVIEVATLEALSDQSLTFLDRIAPAVATAFEVAQSRSALREQQGALQASNEELSAQSERLLNSQQELEKQQRALERSNRELEEQAKELAASEAELQRQQASLEVANADLERNNAALETQKEELDSIRINAEAQAEALARSNRAQSDFTNRLSHELRTPLNSILLISKSLAGNRDENLTDAQTRELDMIHESGSNLLDLINEILDHSKIEAGRLEVRPALARVSELARLTRDQFAHMAADQQLEFEVDVADSAPPEIVTDAQRLMQVIKNLVSNALKFTTKGGVFVRFAALDNERAEQLGVARRGDEMLLTVRDSGIGIAEGEQALIFDAFRQVDSGDSRRYGGTGLGLNITKQLIGLLGGSISVESTPEVGSTFYVVLPAALEGEQEERALPSEGAQGHFIEAGHRSPGFAALPEPLSDERDQIDEESSVILIVEDDRHFAELLQKEVRSEGFMTLLALDGEAGIALSREFKPKGVLLDLQLPGMDGWSVLQALKADLQTRHIPVHIISVEERTPRGLNMGAIGHLTKPVQP